MKWGHFLFHFFVKIWGFINFTSLFCIIQVTLHLQGQEQHIANSLVGPFKASLGLKIRPNIKSIKLRDVKNNRVYDSIRQKIMVLFSVGLRRNQL